MKTLINMIIVVLFLSQPAPAQTTRDPRSSPEGTGPLNHLNLSPTAFAAGTYAIGPQASYAGYAGRFPSLTAAVTAMTGASLTGNLIFEFQRDYGPAVESFPISMPQTIASSAVATVTIRPATDVSSVINLSAAGTIITIAGADHVTFDGRNGGTGGNRFLQFTNTTTAGPAVSLTNDAMFTHFQYCVLKGSTTTASSGILFIGATLSGGNNSYTVNQCMVDGSGLANNCLFATGLGADAVITGTSFFNYRNGAGIYLASGSNNAIIDNNSFFQTDPYTGFAGTTSGIIAAGGNNCRISNNSIGGSGPGITGTWTVSATTPAAYNFTGISASLGTTSRIYNNRIQNIDWKSAPATWTGINGFGTVNIGTDGANLIGSDTGNDNIRITYCNTNGTATFNGILMGGASVRTENNSIGAITTLLSGATGIGSSFYGIVNSAGTAVISNNIIGSETTPRSINVANQTTTGNVQNVYGINCTSLGTLTISGNTIANLHSGITLPSAAVGMMRGIKIQNSGTAISITSNRIWALSTPQPMTGAGISGQNIVGMDINAPGAALTVTANEISDLANTAATGAVNVCGIFCQTSPGAPNTLERNLIQSFLTQSNAAVQTGFTIASGSCAFQNNVIRLGTDMDGNSLTSTPLITGILKSSGAQASHFYFNTVSIGGTGVDAGSVNTYALNVTQHSTEDIRDNILLNLRSGGGKNYAIRIPGSAPDPAGIVCDANDLYAPGTGGVVGFYNNAEQATLSAWQTATARDQNSRTVDPQFVSVTDLRPSAPALNNAGTPVAGITTDFANVTRGFPTPDIGAFEFTVTYAITATAGPNGSLSPSGTVTVDHGANQAFTFAPDPGYRVAAFTIDGTQAAPVPPSPFTFTNVASPGHTIDVQFEPDTYVLTINATHGEVTLDPPGGRYASGTAVTLRATPAEGYQFAGWNGDLTGSTNPATMTMTADGNITATFSINAYLLHVSVVGNGTVVRVPERASYDHGTVVRLTAAPPPGDSFTGWSGDLNGTTNPVDLTMDAPKTVVAHFAGIRLYLSNAPTATAGGIISPDSSWRATVTPPCYQGIDDWSISSTKTLMLMAVPEVGSRIGAADVTLEWDPGILELLNVDFANSVFSGPNLALAAWDRLGTANRVRINASLVAPNNATIQRGDFLATLEFCLKSPGHSTIAAIAADIRSYNSDMTQSSVPVTQHPAQVKAYLGDVATQNGTTAGDGNLDFNDFAPWSTSYWSGVDGYAPAMTYYKAKFDIGPTITGGFFSLPAHTINSALTPGPDGRIDFEDLVIFSIGYGLSHRGELPKARMNQESPMVVATAGEAAGPGEVHIPVFISGGVSDVRALSLVVRGRFGRFLGVRKGALLNGYATPVPLLARCSGDSVEVDLAVMGLDAPGLGSEGELLVLSFEEHARVGVAKADCRSSLNTRLAVEIKNAREELPTTIALAQNYPNPFNPTTTIEYQVPAPSKIELAVYNVLGELVANLVDELKEAGNHRVTWNGRTTSGAAAAAGVYFCRMSTGRSTSVRSMLLIR